jgi:antitoxin MazE
MTTKVRKWGHSQGLRLPKQILREARIEVGDEIELAASEGEIVIRRAQDRRRRKRHDLEELLKDYPDGYRVGEVDWGPPVGREVCGWPPATPGPATWWSFRLIRRPATIRRDRGPASS